MSDANAERFSKKNILKGYLKLFDEAEARHPSLKPALDPTRKTIAKKVDDSYVKITSREQCEVEEEANLLLQADRDLTDFEGNKNAQAHIIKRITDIHPTYN